jgi:hypothetical protein
VPVDYSEKVRQNRVRRAVQRRGYVLQGSRALDPTHPSRGLWRVVRPDEAAAVPFHLSLDDLEAWLDSGEFQPPRAKRTSTFLDGKGGNEARQSRWLTPRFVVDALRAFDLDPCGAPSHVLAERTYLLENGDDGLRDPWSGRVWLNPPYGRETGLWLQRLVEHGTGTALIFARTETVMFKKHVWPHAHGLLFLEGRLRFLDADLQQAGIAPAPSALVAYGIEDAALLQQSGLRGHFVSLR